MAEKVRVRRTCCGGSTILSSANRLDLFRLVLEQAPDGIIFADREGVIQIWNGAAAELFGYLPQEAVGCPLDIIIPEHLRPAHWEGTRSMEHAL